MTRKRLWITAASAAVAIVITAAIALALWSASGSGSATGAASTAKGLVVSAVSPSGSSASLYPGGPAGSVSLTIQNSNPYAVTVTGVSWGTPSSTNPSACPDSNISLDGSAPSTVSVDVPANGASSPVLLANVLDLARTAPDGCQGVAFNVPVTVTGTQQ